MNTVWILGDQLSFEHAALARTAPGESRVLMIESKARGSVMRYHQLELVLVYSAMRHFAHEPASAGISSAAIRTGSRRALELAQRARAVLCDRGYLRHQKLWRREVADQARCRVVEVESDVIVPVESASQKTEYAARTLRPRIQRQLAEHLRELIPAEVQHRADHLELPASVDLRSTEALARSGST